MGAGFIDSRRTGERQGDAVVRFALFAFLSLFLATASIAADYEYGSLDELKGVSRVYIDAGNAVDLRNIMATVNKFRVASISVSARGGVAAKRAERSASHRPRLCLHPTQAWF